jgi:TonB family protein
MKKTFVFPIVHAVRASAFAIALMSVGTASAQLKTTMDSHSSAPSLNPSDSQPNVDIAFMSANPPEYPRRELEFGLEGTTSLFVLVDETGQPAAIAIQYSSGNKELDMAAVNAAYRWKFQPGRLRGMPVPGIARVPVAFHLFGNTNAPLRTDLPGGEDFFKQTDKRKVAEIEENASKGDTDASFLVGEMYWFGLGVRKDKVKSMEWFEKSAVQGNAVAQNILGGILEQGDGVPKDPVKAAEWYGKAAAQGNAAAQTSLGIMFARGEGVTKNSHEAEKLFQKAASQGFAYAEYKFGLMYESGDGVEKNDAKAVEWYQKAAIQGYPNAEFNLGGMYSHGRGVPRDVPKAMEWLEKAASHGHVGAANNLGWILAKGDGVPKDSVKAMEWYRKAAAHGDVRAFGNIGWMYEHGEGVERDDVLAYAWLTLAANHGLDAMAAKQGVEPETKDLPALEKTLTPAELLEAKQLSSTWSEGHNLLESRK